MFTKFTENIFHKESYILEQEVFLDNKLIKIYLTKFWDDVMNNVDKKQIVLLLFRVRFGDEDDLTKKGHYATIGNLFKFNNSKNDFNKLYEVLKALLDNKDQYYKNLPIVEIVFSYKIVALDNNKISKSSNLTKNIKIKEKSTSYKFKGYNLPNTMNLKLWGDILIKEEDKVLIRKKGSKYNYNVNIINNNPLTYNVTLQFPNNEVFLTFTDVQNNDFNNLNSFTRYVGPNEYYFTNGELVLRLNPRKISYLECLNLYKNRFGKKIVPMIDQKIITLDIETQVINNVIKPVLISIYDGQIFYNFYLPDFNNEVDMINIALQTLLNTKYDGYKIYVHNLSHFDGIFLMKHLVDLKYNDQNVNINPTLKDGKMINLDIKFDRYKISFRDSLLILLASLKKLAKAFGVENKGTFDFKSVDDLSVLQLNNKTLRDEIINYCNLDCKILYDVLIKFNDLIFDLFKLNINSYPTLPGLALGIFRSKYLTNKTVPLITGQPFQDLKQSYTGGSVDTIINHGKNLYYYDINSLYPSVMMNNYVPIGNMKAFTGNVWKINPQAFGFFEAIVTAPDNLNIPILQLHHNNRTISPLGIFKGWFFSEELRNAIDNFGYKIEILGGYTFDQKIIFNEFVNDFYNLRLQYDKSHPMNYIAKILMNSLYGRFGLNPILSKFIVIDKDEFDDFVDNNEINEAIDLDNKFLISILDKNKFDISLISSFNTDMKTNVAIASSITAHSRIVLSKMKKYCLDNDIKLYYFDTDSIFIDKPLPSEMVGKEIGKWKLEAHITEAVFLAPKVYGYVDQDGNEIVKIKGYKNPVSFNQLKSLLIKDNKLELNQEKWFKSLEKSEISILNQIYTLIPTANKRNLIYNNNNILERTIPFYIDTIKKSDK